MESREREGQGKFWKGEEDGGELKDYLFGQKNSQEERIELKDYYCYIILKRYL